MSPKVNFPAFKAINLYASLTDNKEMDIVTDLTAEAVAFLTLLQDILKGHQEHQFPENLVAKENWTKLTENDIIVNQLTPNELDRMSDLVWHSPTRESPKILIRQYSKITLGLLKWISRNVADEPGSISSSGWLNSWTTYKGEERIFFRPPFFWRQQIRSVLYAKPEERLSLADQLKYMPLQVILVLEGKGRSAYEIRLFQFYDLKRLELGDVEDYWDVLSSSDRELYDTWWRDKEQRARDYLVNDTELLTALKKLEFPLPFETLFRDELIEITKARNARRHEMNISSTGSKRSHYRYSKVSAEDGNIFDPLEKAKSMRLIGIALSGGGIRSATFNLGILQRLASLDVLQHFDYISTVSGGGYVGTWFNSWVKRSGSFSKINDRLCPEKSADPLADEVRPIRWLRMFSNYLTPNVGIMSPDAWSSGMTWLRNALINQFVLLLILVTTLSCISDLFLGWKRSKNYLVAFELTAKTAFVSTFIMLFIGTLLAAIAMRSFYKPEKKKKWTQLAKFIESQKLSWSWITNMRINIPVWIVVWVGICALIISTYFAATGQPPNDKQARLYVAGSIGAAALAALLILATWGNYDKRLDLMRLGRNNIVGPSPDNSTYNLWPTRFAIFGSSLVAAITFAYLIDLFWQCMTPIYNEIKWRYRLDFEKMVLVTAPPVILEIFSIVVIVRMALMGNLFPDYRREWWGRLGGNIHRLGLIWILVSFASLIMPDLWHYVPEVVLPAWGGWAGIVGWGLKKAYDSRDPSQKNGKLAETLLKVVPFIFMIGFLIIGAWVTGKIEKLEWLSANPESLVRNITVTAVLALTTYVFSWRVGVNEFSLHHFYRNRLIRAYMGATRTREDRVKTANSFTGFDTTDDILLSTMQVKDGYFGPFPIINTTLNSTVVFALDRQDRKAESFLFSPLYCGYDFSPTRSSTYNIDHIYEYGYRPTAQFSNVDGGPTLGTAMAISGAAVNPNQGHNSSATLAFLLTIFNIRLGWWIGNPRLNKWKKADPRYGMMYLLSDLLGKSDINMNYVCLSDGGHFDNMGLYELVRRRCSYILIGDGEQDSEGICEGLSNAIRRCRIDFGVEINIDLTPITKKEKDKHSKHIVKGEILYPGNHEKGTLIYIKAVVIGDEPVDVREYALLNKDFPQQSTADQFFDEAQFESYRKLGYHSIKDLRELHFP